MIDVQCMKLIFQSGNFDKYQYASKQGIPFAIKKFCQSHALKLQFHKHLKEVLVVNESFSRSIINVHYAIEASVYNTNGFSVRIKKII